MKTGFYLYKDVIGTLKDVDNPSFRSDNENCYASAYDFLQGSCQIFARELSDRFGYSIKKIENDKYGLHVFCSKDDKLFIDVGGITDSFFEFERDLCGHYTEDDISPYDEEDIEDLDAKEFAIYLIGRYRDIYKVK